MARRQFSHYASRRRAEIRHRRFIPLFIFSVVIAALGFWLGPLRWLLFGGGNGVPLPATISLCIFVAWGWLAVFVAGLFLCRARALWLLVEVPLVLYFPATFILSGACSLAGRCH